MRPLGATGIAVSPIGLGTVKIGRNTGVKYPGAFELPSDERVDELLRAAADLGVNLIDTAPAYGTSEARLGEAMSRRSWFGSRGRWVVSTKAGEEYDGGTSRFDFSGAAIRASVRRSLERLRTDYLDVVLVHSDGNDAAIVADGGAIGALVDLKARGVVRAIGMSVKSTAGGLAAIGAPLADVSGQGAGGGHGWCDVLMCTLNQGNTSELGLIRAAHERGVGVLIKKAFESGHAAGGDAVGFVFRSAGAAVSSVVTGTISAAHLRANVEAARTAAGERGSP